MAVKVSTEFRKTPLSLETGKWARQADGSVTVQQGGTVVLVTAVAAPSPTERPIDIIPLTCDYREKTYAAGKIPGGFFKREGRPTEKEILSCRLMDRPLRPMFPKGFLHEIQVIATVLSSDGEYDPDVLAVIGASAALRLSSITFPDPLGCVRVGLVNNQPVAFPTYQELAQSPIDLVVAGTKHGVLMMEGGFKEVPEQQLVEAINFGYEQVKAILALQEELASRAGKPKREDWTIRKPGAELVAKVRELAAPAIAKANGPGNKAHRHEVLADSLAEIKEKLTADDTILPFDVFLAFSEIEWEETRKAILGRKTRIDGRQYTQLREVTCEVGVLPRTHGSGLFTRGETQSLAVTTLGTSDDEQLIESLEGESYKRFMLHYNFPPFSVNEVRPIRGTGRREIGHGALAERSIEPMVPSKDEFPYTVRVVSDILESNGSSSMATVCSASLSLMDAGVPVKAAVSGVAMGLVTGGKEAAILTDISGLEDHVGDMDFKVAGTRLGTTGLQVDVKLEHGLSLELIKKIIDQSHPARMTLLDLMAAAIERPRADLSAFAPRITTLKINPEKIRDIIGPGGRNIRKIIADTGTSIDVEDDGSVFIASADAEKAKKAVEIIRAITDDVEVGKVYNGKVKRIMNFGAFCEILPGKEGLVHISELADKYVSKVEDVVKIGDEFRVKVIEIDEQGRINLSRKRALEPRDEKAS